MKKLLLLSLLSLWFNSNSQDKIIKRSGDTLKVTIKQVTADRVEFVYPNEEILVSENKKQFSKIIYKSGRIEICNEDAKLSEIKGEDDWEKVILTNAKTDVIGLTSVGEVSGKSGWGGMASSTGDKAARKKIKKEAAKLKSPIVYVTSFQSDEGGVRIHGIAYK